MLHLFRLPLTFLVFAVLAGSFGFGIIANTSSSGGRILFVVFLSLAVLSFTGSWLSRKSFSG